MVFYVGFSSIANKVGFSDGFLCCPILVVNSGFKSSENLLTKNVSFFSFLIFGWIRIKNQANLQSDKKYCIKLVFYQSQFFFLGFRKILSFRIQTVIFLFEFLIRQPTDRWRFLDFLTVLIRIIWKFVPFLFLWKFVNFSMVFWFFSIDFPGKLLFY